MGLHVLDSGYLLSEYRIQKLLGEGGFGLTYLAFDTLLEKKVAIKEYMPSEHAVRNDNTEIIPKSKASEKVYNWGLNAFLNEAKILAKFEDSNIVRVYRFFKANGTAYIVMEYCEGGCLVDLISKDKEMDESELKTIISSIVQGLQLVHNDGILHRDIKPDNIMFRQNGKAVLIDFGAAREAIGKKSTKVTTIITPGFAPLEQYSSKGIIGPWSDIYSLSAVAYTCITGSRPPDIMNRLHEDTILKLGDKKTSSEFLKSIDKGLRLQVDERPKSLSEWSSKWSNHKLTDSPKFELSKQFKPIVASRTNSSDRRTTINKPISARTSLRPHEKTVLNAEKSSSGFLKSLMIFVIFLTIAVGGYYAYEYKLLQDKKARRIIEQKEQLAKEELKIIKQRKELTFSIQQLLKALGYNIVASGFQDDATIQGIKEFEAKIGLLVTGKIDKLILKELNQEFKIVDNIAWKNANNINTKSSYQKYLSNFPNGVHVSQVPINIENSQNALTPKGTKSPQKIRLQQILADKKQLITDIQKELIRLKFKDLTVTGELDNYTKNSIKAYQKFKRLDQNGLPTKTLLFKLKSQEAWFDKSF